MYGQATPHCLYNSPAYNEELIKKRGRERASERVEGGGKEGEEDI